MTATDPLAAKLLRIVQQDGRIATVEPGAALRSVADGDHLKQLTGGDRETRTCALMEKMKTVALVPV